MTSLFYSPLIRETETENTFERISKVVGTSQYLSTSCRDTNHDSLGNYRFKVLNSDTGRITHKYDGQAAIIADKAHRSLIEGKFPDPIEVGTLIQRRGDHYLLVPGSKEDKFIVSLFVHSKN